MAVVAIVATGDVRCILARGCDTIVTRTAGTYHLGMINCVDGRKYVGRVTVFAHGAGLNVCRVLTDSIGTVVATEAVSCDIDVVKIGRQPGNRGMTIIAVVTTCDVGWMLASRRDAIVAGAATTDHLSMINDIRRCPDVRIVAVLTDIRGLYVSQRLTRRSRAIMAADTVARDAGVIEYRRPPSDRCVAVVADIIAGNMCRVLARSRDAVMTGAANADNLRVIYGKHRRKYVSAMAVLTDVACLDVRRILADSIGTVVTTDAIAGDVDVIKIGR